MEICRRLYQIFWIFILWIGYLICCCGQLGKGDDYDNNLDSEGEGGGREEEEEGSLPLFPERHRLILHSTASIQSISRGATPLSLARTAHEEGAGNMTIGTGGALSTVSVKTETPPHHKDPILFKKPLPFSIVSILQDANNNMEKIT